MWKAGYVIVEVHIDRGYPEVLSSRGVLVHDHVP
jgi:hypothetical protein